jgi:nicotinamide riboside kinase
MSTPRMIFIIGPSSTGKTTLCTALAQRLAIPPSAHITEVAREVMRSTGFSRKDVGTLDMQGAILTAQLGREEAALDAKRAHRVVLSDRSGIDPAVYAILTAKNEEEAEVRKKALTDNDAFEHARERYRHSLVVLLAPVTEWLVDDGVRALDDHERCSTVFKQVLQWVDVPYKEMGGECRDLSDRVDKIIAYARLDGARL